MITRAKAKKKSPRKYGGKRKGLGPARLVADDLTGRRPDKVSMPGSAVWPSRKITHGVSPPNSSPRGHQPRYAGPRPLKKRRSPDDGNVYIGDRPTAGLQWHVDPAIRERVRRASDMHRLRAPSPASPPVARRLDFGETGSSSPSTPSVARRLDFGLDSKHSPASSPGGDGDDEARCRRLNKHYQAEARKLKRQKNSLENWQEKVAATKNVTDALTRKILYDCGDFYTDKGRMRPKKYTRKLRAPKVKTALDELAAENRKKKRNEKRRANYHAKKAQKSIDAVAGYFPSLPPI